METNKIKYGIKNVHIAIQTKGSDGTYTYGTPVALPGAVSMSLESQGESSQIYADNLIYWRAVNALGYSGDLEIALIPDWFRRNILKEIKDTNGVLIERNDDINPVYFAMLFEFEGDKYPTRHVLYNCTVSSRPSLSSQTKEETIEPGTETLSIAADPREDGLITARTSEDTTSETYQNWYNAVYVPGEADESEQAEAQISILTLGNLTLTPTFAAGTKTYTASTSGSGDTITAVGADGATVSITVNGSAHTNGTTASWNEGENAVVITASASGKQAGTYTVTVTKANG